MTIRELREMAGMSRREFAEYFHISYRTVQDSAGLGAGMQQVQGLYYKGFLLPASLPEKNH